MSLDGFVILGLAIWRVSSLLAREDGPYKVLTALRFTFGMRYDEKSEPYPTTMLSELIMCVWCNSLWISLAACLYIFGLQWEYLLMYTLSLSAFAILTDRIAHGAC